MTIKLRAFASASILAAIVSATGVAHAGAIYGGGSSLIAPYLRQAADCYGTPKPLYGRTGATTSPTIIAVTPFVYGTTDCSVTHATTNIVQYISTGSGTGIAALYSHDATRYGDINPNSAGVQTWTTVQYGLSETALLAADVTTYNTGGTIQGITLTDSPPPSGANQYHVPLPLYGKLIQFPVLVAPVALAYDPAYKKVRNGDGTITTYNLNVQALTGRTNGGLKLDKTTYCKIFRGEITNWNDPALTTLNNNVSLKDPADTAAFDVPLQIVGRQEGSGTTNLFTRHLATVCGASGAGSDTVYTNVNGTSTLPAVMLDSTGGIYDKSLASNDPVSGETVGKFTVAQGNDGVAKYADFTRVPGTTAGDTVVQGRLAYLGADYALPAAAANGLTATLFTADLKNAAGNYRQPSSGNATNGFASYAPPQTVTTDTNGTYDASNTANGLRTNPQDWVPVTANPTGIYAYPIVGSTNFIGYTCYASTTTAAAMAKPLSYTTPGFWNYWFDQALIDNTSATTPGVVPHAGLAPLPAIWQNAINKTFINMKLTGAVPSLNLYISPAAANAVNPDCASVPGA